MDQTQKSPYSIGTLPASPKVKVGWASMISMSSVLPFMGSHSIYLGWRELAYGGVIVSGHGETHLGWKSGLAHTPCGCGVWRGTMNVLPNFKRVVRFFILDMKSVFCLGGSSYK